MDYSILFPLSLLGSLFIASMAQISIDLPKKISPVPITMQTYAVTLLPCLFGYKIAVFSCLLYILEIAIGLPFGGVGGLTKLYHTTGGYFVGYIMRCINMLKIG